MRGGGTRSDDGTRGGTGGRRSREVAPAAPPPPVARPPGFVPGILRFVRVASLLLALSLLAAGPAARAGDTTTAADATEPGRRLDRALDIVLDGSARNAGAPRTLCVLVDPSASLATAGFPDRLEAALERNASKAAGTEFAVLKVGEREPVVQPPTADRAAAAKAVRDALAGAKNTVRNVYADVRAAAALLAARSGARELVLVTLENGDVEDDLEGTLTALRRAKVRTYVLATEAFLADSYATSHPTVAPPKGATWTGGDGAFAEIPWGWLFQMANPNEAAASGYAAYGLTRLCAATEGRLFLVADGAAPAHSCVTLGLCAFCAGDHVASGEVYQPARLRALAPLVEPRETVYAAAAHDPCWRAVHAAWRDAADAGLLRSRPSLELSGGGARPEKRLTGPWAALTGNGLAFASLAGRAGKALEACDRIRLALDADLGKLKPDEGSPRWRAVAEYVRLMLHVTRVNLLQFVGWCQEVGPVVSGRKPAEPPIAPPETAWFADATRMVGVSYTNWSLCHGVRPYLELHLPGGPALRDALTDLDGVYRAYMVRYAGTPFAVAGHRAAIAHFLPTVQGKVLPPPPKKTAGSTGDSPTTPSERPTRESGGSSGGGATTSGG